MRRPRPEAFEAEQAKILVAEAEANNLDNVY
jgi:hypothetical protein